MAGAELLARVRRAAGLSQDELARRAGTSRTPVSAYEHGHRSPALDTVDRLVRRPGDSLMLGPSSIRRRSGFSGSSGGRANLAAAAAGRASTSFGRAAVDAQLVAAGAGFRLVDRGDRARVYELVLREGTEADVIRYVDGVLLVDLWDELVLARAVRAAWSPLIAQILGVSDVCGTAS